MNDTRLGRFLSTDPLTAMTPWETPYAFANNSPIAKIDWLGLSGETANNGGGDNGGGNGGGKDPLVDMRQWSEGFDPVAEAKRGVRVSPEMWARLEMQRGGIDPYTIDQRLNNESYMEHINSAIASGDLDYARNQLSKQPLDGSANDGTEFVEGMTTFAFYGIGGPLVMSGATIMAPIVTGGVVREGVDAGVDLAWEGATGLPSPFIFGVSDFAEYGIKRLATTKLNTCPCGVICFVGGTKVLADDLTNIEELELGQLVTVSLEHKEVADQFASMLGSSSIKTALYQTPIELNTWTALEMYMLKEGGDTLFIELLRPNWWVEKYMNQVGDKIYLTLEEMAISGEAVVTNISAANFQVDNHQSDKRPIIGKFTNKSDGIYRLYFEGLEEPIGVTAKHPIWSVTRLGWIDAESLEEGELVQSETGEHIRLLTKVYEPETHTTYNIEVYDAHNYFVSDAAILVHNTGGNPCDFIAGNGGNISALKHSEIIRIENAATRINKPITIVGSRSVPGLVDNGINTRTNTLSDWDFVIEGLTRKGRKKIKNSIPGSKSLLDNTPQNYDIFTSPLIPDKPFITIFPRK